MAFEDMILLKHKLEKDIVLNYLELNESDIVLFCGSVVEGFSNAGSDLDVYVISTTDYKLPSNREVSNTYLGKEYHIFDENIPINVIVMTLNTASSIVEDINSQLFLEKIDFNESRKIEFYHRLITSIPVKGSNKFKDLIGRKLYPEKFQFAVTRNRLSYSENRHDDAVGAMESNDFLTGYIAARISLEKAVESLLFIQGQTNPKDKWIIKKLFNVYKKDEEWVQEFISMYLGQLKDLSEDTINENTIKMIRLASKIRGLVINKI